MSQAMGDPDELENFAHILYQFIETMDDSVGNVNAAFTALGDSWQDEKRIQFEETYNELVQYLSQFKIVAEDQVYYLRTLAERLRAYLDS